MPPFFSHSYVTVMFALNPYVFKGHSFPLSFHNVNRNEGWRAKERERERVPLLSIPRFSSLLSYIREIKFLLHP